ncbi:MAG: hypothetical protein ACYDAJ_02585 [Nitrosotalea sp.]
MTILKQTTWKLIHWSDIKVVLTEDSHYFQIDVECLGEIIFTKRFMEHVNYDALLEKIQVCDNLGKLMS